MVDQETTSDENRVVSDEEIAPDESYFYPDEAASDLLADLPSCVQIEYKGPRHVIAWNRCRRSLNLKAFWAYCPDGPCLTIPPNWGYDTSRSAFFCRFDGFRQCSP
jgi:hypothetical protein